MHTYAKVQWHFNIWTIDWHLHLSCVVLLVTFIFAYRCGRDCSLPAPPGSAMSDALSCTCGNTGGVAALSSPWPARLPDLPLSESFTGALSLDCSATTDDTEQHHLLTHGGYTEQKCRTEQETAQSVWCCAFSSLYRSVYHFSLSSTIHIISFQLLEWWTYL